MGVKDFNFKKEIQRLGATQRNIVTAALIILLAISLACLYEDYSTSREGLLRVPGALANPWIRWLLAFAPSALQIAFTFMAITQRSRFAGLVVLLAWVFDFATDMAYKMQGVEPTIGNVIVVALFAFFVASFFSEFMLLFAAQNLAYAVGPRFRKWWAGIQAQKAAAEAGQGSNNGLLDEIQQTMFPKEERPAPKATSRAQSNGRGKLDHWEGDEDQYEEDYDEGVTDYNGPPLYDKTNRRNGRK